VTNHKTAGSIAGNQYGTFTVRYASPAQQRFIAKLLDERDHTLGDIDPATVNVQHASGIIDQLLKSPVRADKVTLLSDKQLAFINSLRGSRVGGEDFLVDFLTKQDIAIDALPSQSAKSLIDGLLRLPAVMREVTVDVGAYLHDGVVYSVRRGRESGKLHAYNWQDSAWVYSGNVKYELKPEMRLSLVEAMEFGAQTGTCVHCGRTLTDPDSVRFGIGSTCRKRYDAKR
jgi:hypothetical protein